MEIGQMSLLGIALTKKDKREKEAGTIYVEYHQCDKCGAEYRVYLRSQFEVEGAFQELAKRLGNKREEADLCFNCQNKVIVDQMMLPLEA